MNLSFSKKVSFVIATGVFIFCAMQSVAADIPKLSLTQRASDIVTPPKEGNPGILDLETVEDEATIEITVSNIRNDVPMDVYLAFSTRLGTEDDWPSCRVGQIELDSKSIGILSAVRIGPVENFYTPDNVLGKVEFKTQAVVFTVTLSDLSSPELYGDTIFFQALSVPAKSTDIRRCQQTSEVDEYEIKR